MPTPLAIPLPPRPDRPEEPAATLVLREMWTAPAMHRLTVANLDRLREFEHWAHAEQTLRSQQAYTRQQLLDWVDGRAVPFAIESSGELVGSVGARIDRWNNSAEIGCWIDGAHEGRGLVLRAMRRMIEHLFDDHLVARVEARTSAHNPRTRVLNERLGMVHEGTLRNASQVGTERHDVAVWSILRPA
jgi:ribosomal-protein-serine acetyltransferase